MGAERDEAMRQQEATEAMIRMREPVPRTAAPKEPAPLVAWAYLQIMPGRNAAPVWMTTTSPDTAEALREGGVALVELVAKPSRAALATAWRNFLEANPDDLTSPEDCPDHALVTFDQMAAMVEEASEA